MHDVEIETGEGYVVARISGDYGGIADGKRVIGIMSRACEMAGCRALVLVREAGRAANPLQLVEMVQGLGTLPLAGWRLALMDLDAALLERASEPAVKQRLLSNTEAALHAGIYGAPSFVVE